MIDCQQYTTFAEVVDEAGRVYGDQPFVIDGDRRLSFAEFSDRVSRTATLLADRGVGSGDIVSLVLKNSIEYLLVYFAVTRLGAVISPLPFHLGRDELLEKIRFLGPRLVCVEAPHADPLAAAGAPCYVVTEGFLDTAGAAAPSPDPVPAVEDAVGYLYYSSGTTGLPKMIEYSHRSELLALASQLRSGFRQCLGPHLCFLPLGHTAAIRYSLLPCLIAGYPLFVYESFWKLRPRLWDEVAEHSAVYFQVVPAILNMMLNTKYPDYVRDAVPTLRLIGSGSSYLPVVMQQRCEEQFGIRVANLYGLSETGATHFDDPLADDWRPGGIGRPIDIADVVIMDEDGHPVPSGAVGEIAVRGPSLLRGYHENEELYRSCLTDGYFRTGDLGAMDEQGRYTYIDRKKDLIIKGGVNIAPAQIDAVLCELPAVREAATVAVPDPYLGETIKSFVVVQEGAAVSDEELKAYCRDRLGDFKTPSHIETIAELPKGPSGKILKRELRERG